MISGLVHSSHNNIIPLRKDQISPLQTLPEDLKNILVDDLLSNSELAKVSATSHYFQTALMPNIEPRIEKIKSYLNPGFLQAYNLRSSGKKMSLGEAQAAYSIPSNRQDKYVACDKIGLDYLKTLGIENNSIFIEFFNSERLTISEYNLLSPANKRIIQSDEYQLWINDNPPLSLYEGLVFYFEN